MSDVFVLCTDAGIGLGMPASLHLDLASAQRAAEAEAGRPLIWVEDPELDATWYSREPQDFAGEQRSGPDAWLIRRLPGPTDQTHDPLGGVQPMQCPQPAPRSAPADQASRVLIPAHAGARSSLEALLQRYQVAAAEMETAAAACRVIRRRIEARLGPFLDACYEAEHEVSPYPLQWTTRALEVAADRSTLVVTGQYLYGDEWDPALVQVEVLVSALEAWQPRMSPPKGSWRVRDRE